MIVKNKRKKLLKRMCLTPDQATEIAQRFVREQIGRDIPLAVPADLYEPRSGTWAVYFGEDMEAGVRMDPSGTLVLVDDASGAASFFLAL